MLIYQEFLVLNEEHAAFDPQERLRYAVHEIMMRYEDGATVKFDEMSKMLKDEFQIDIPVEILKEIFSRWDKYQNADYSVFKKEDKNWMDVWPYQNYVKRKKRDKQSFGKHRRKSTTSTNTYWGGFWNRGKWVKYDKSNKSGGNNRNYNPNDDYYHNDYMSYD